MRLILIIISFPAQSSWHSPGKRIAPYTLRALLMRFQARRQTAR